MIRSVKSGSGGYPSNSNCAEAGCRPDSEATPNMTFEPRGANPLRVGDIVVTMSYRGLFRIRRIAGDQLTIVDPIGVTKIVLRTNARRLATGPDLLK